MRLYLGALMLADIISDDGRNILPWALTGRSRAKEMIQTTKLSISGSSCHNHSYDVERWMNIT
eukprot:935925-Ditylum_brightwellii.AAC.1